MTAEATPASLDYLRDELPHIYYSNSIELSDVQQAMDYYAPVFHTAKLEEVEGMPSEQDANKIVASKYATISESEAFLDSYLWLKPIAQSVIAKKDAEISTLKSEISRLKGEALGDGSCGKSWSPQDQR